MAGVIYLKNIAFITLNVCTLHLYKLYITFILDEVPLKE